MRSYRLKRLLRTGGLTLLLWVLTMATAAYLWLDVGQRMPILAFAEAVEHRVAATVVGRIERLEVRRGDRVHKGQIVARLRSLSLDGEAKVESARIKQLEAAIAAASANTHWRAVGVRGSLARDRGRAQTSLANARAALKGKRVELAAVDKQLQELSRLLKRGLVVRRDLLRVELRRAALAREIAAARAAAGVARQQLRRTQRQRRTLPAGPSQNFSTARLTAEVEVARRRLDRIEALRKALVLRAPTGGRVSLISMRQGEVVKIGATVLTIVAESTSRAVACVFEHEAVRLKVGTSVTLYSRGAGRRTLKGVISAVDPMVRQLPMRCWAQPRQPVWGRAAVIDVDTGDLVSGQAFNVRLESCSRSRKMRRLLAAPKRQSAKLRGGSKRRALAEPTRPLVVPPALLRVGRFEPSGLRWMPELGRYLVVSDDTGHKDTTEHRPWLFAMDRRGRLDERPLVVEGAKRFNDLESISRDSQGRVFVLASQAYSKKGKRKRSRQRLFQLQVSKEGIRAVAQQTLAEKLDDAGGPTLAKLALRSTRQLNIEGMTALQKGGLLLGLKAPVDRRGRALLWKLAHPQRFLRTGSLAAAGLTLYGAVTLKVEADGETVPGGFADLLELKDGSLLAAATASGRRPKTQSGSLWHLKRNASGRFVGKRLRVFAGLKPEGLALSPGGDRLLVIFDTAAKTPRWVELPWPLR